MSVVRAGEDHTMKQIRTINVDETRWNEFRAAAADMDLSTSALIRALIDMFLKSLKSNS